MTPQEQQLLQGLAERINATVLPDKDPEAEQFIGQSLGRNPDAMYILAQTVLVQQYALDQAKQQLDQARQTAQPQKHTSFLGSLLGQSEEPQRPAPPPPPPYAPVSNYAPQPVYGAPPPYGMAQPAGMFGSQPGGGGFLRSAIQTAGGVAAGALAFEGIESLLHGFGQHAGYGGAGFGSFGGGGGQPREEVTNNYYGDSGGEHGLSPDIEDRRDAGQDQGRGLSDSGDSTNFDPTDPDANSFDDTSSADDDNFDPDGNDDSQ